MFSTVVGFICNVVRPLFTEWHRLLVSPLSLLLLDNLQANLQRWQSVSTDNVSLLTAADSSDDSSPSSADQGDRIKEISVSSEVGPSKPTVIVSGSDGSSVQCGTQTVRRASLPPLSAAAVARVNVRRCSSPVVGSQHMSCRRVYYLSSLAEDPAPLIAAPSPPFSEQLNTTATELDISRLEYNDGLNNVGKNGHKDVISTDSNVCLPASETRRCSVRADGTVQISENDSTQVICANDISGALLNGVRRGSAPVICSARLPNALATRRCSAPSPGAKLIAVSLWTSKMPFDAEPTAGVHCRQSSVVLVESPHCNVGVDQLSFVCVLTNSGSLKVPVERDIGRCRGKRSHSAHTVVINPSQFVERRFSSPLSSHRCWDASNLISQSSSTNSCTPISGVV